LNDDSKIPISYNDDPADKTGHGAAATVFGATIDSGNRNFQTGQDDNFIINVSKPRKGGTADIHDQAKNERSFLEALTAKNIQHAHILKSHTGFEYKMTFYMVSECGSGILLDLVNKDECFNGANAGVDYDWVSQQFKGLAGALAEIHGSDEKGYHGFHHDIKPQNILVFSIGHAYDEQHSEALRLGFGRHDETSPFCSTSR
jgi:serine/threonine protein kinase